jgi:hypothetical protein
LHYRKDFSFNGTVSPGANLPLPGIASCAVGIGQRKIKFMTFAPASFRFSHGFIVQHKLFEIGPAMFGKRNPDILLLRQNGRAIEAFDGSMMFPQGVIGNCR